MDIVINSNVQSPLVRTLSATQGKSASFTHHIKDNVPPVSFTKIVLTPDGGAARRSAAGVRGGGSSLPASRPAAVDLGPRAALDHQRSPFAQAPQGVEAEGQAKEEAAQRAVPSVVER